MQAVVWPAATRACGPPSRARPRPARARGRLVDDVLTLLGAADLLVTKAGGMTLAEATAAEVPCSSTARSRARSAQRAFRLARGIALVARTRGELRRLLDRAVGDPERSSAAGLTAAPAAAPSGPSTSWTRRRADRPARPPVTTQFAFCLEAPSARSGKGSRGRRARAERGPRARAAQREGTLSSSAWPSSSSGSGPGRRRPSAARSVQGDHAMAG